jgi:cytochrome c-type biogenesis protein CcmH
MTMRVVIALALVLLAPTPAGAFQPDEVLSDPKLEARARTLSAELRCLVCQNQSIDDSDAPLARDLRVLIRERLVAGDSDGEAMDFVVARYGEFVLLRPRFAPHTLVLWLGPAAILLLGGIGTIMFVRSRRRPLAADEAPPLSDAERRRVEELLADGDRR